MGKVIPQIKIPYYELSIDPETPVFPDRLDYTVHMNTKWSDRMRIHLRVDIDEDWNMRDGFVIDHDLTGNDTLHARKMESIARFALGFISEAFDEFVRTSNLITNNSSRARMDSWLAKVETRLMNDKGMSFDQYIKSHLLPPYALMGPNNTYRMPRIGD